MERTCELSSEEYEKAALLADLLMNSDTRIWNYTYINLLAKVASMKTTAKIDIQKPNCKYMPPISMKRTFALLSEKQYHSVT